jgi:5-methyltetrahydropteroyltriglutamate--homocysteine methyltransferase
MSLIGPTPTYKKHRSMSAFGGHKIVVLGLITTKHGKLETVDEIVRRVDEAARYLPVEQLALSPQCGFGCSGRGNPLTEEEQWRKLELVSSVAETVWKH